MQIPLTLRNVLVRHKGRVVLSDVAADRLYRMGAGPGRYLPAVQMARLEYLWFTKRNPEEMRALAANLIRQVPNNPETSIVERLVQ